ncbi:hypothetical protein VPHD249_0064 [Vibrio phage D249]
MLLYILNRNGLYSVIKSIRQRARRGKSFR